MIVAGITPRLLFFDFRKFRNAFKVFIVECNRDSFRNYAEEVSTKISYGISSGIPVEFRPDISRLISTGILHKFQLKFHQKFLNRFLLGFF